MQTAVRKLTGSYVDEQKALHDFFINELETVCANAGAVDITSAAPGALGLGSIGSMGNAGSLGIPLSQHAELGNAGSLGIPNPFFAQVAKDKLEEFDVPMKNTKDELNV